VSGLTADAALLRPWFDEADVGGWRRATLTQS
jgi:hypothetical protein